MRPIIESAGVEKNEAVLIVGAGPVGLATALALAHQGVPVRVIESEPALTLDPRAGSFHPPTLEMLEPYGVTDAMHRIGLSVPRWQIRDREQGVIVEWDLGAIADLTPFPYRFHLEQHRLTPILYEKLAAFPHAEVRFSTSFIDARQDAGGVTAETSTGTLSAPWLIGCDGGRSAVRKVMRVDFPGFTWPERFLVVSTLADFAALGFTSSAYVADPREWAAMFHMPYDRPGGLWRLAFPVHPEEGEEAILADEAVEARMQRFSPRSGRYPVTQKGIYRVHQRVASDWRTGRVLLAGCSAHLNNPLGGFGLNGGVHDAILLGKYLGRIWRGEAPESLLDLYVRQRRTANIEFVQTQSIANKKLLEEADPAAKQARYAELRAIAADRQKTRDFLVRSSMIWSVRRAAEIT
jgi:3-(3-hydroxy-phenyl)propionate hydroxylase